MIDNGSLRYYLTQPDLQGMKLHIVVSPPEFNVKISAITFEYLKAEILNISKPYLQNLPLK